MSRRIGLFGGTFNPIHKGHMTLARDVQRDFALDELIMIPSKVPPHKQTDSATPENRFEMTKIVADKLGSGFSVSDVEIRDPGVSYTYKTLTKFRAAHPDAALFFVCGSDIFATIEAWENWRELFSYANFIVVNRREMPFDLMLERIPRSLTDIVIDEADYEGQLAGSIILHRMSEINISSTEIRFRMASDRCEEMLLEEVCDYIYEHNLYTEVS